MPLPNQPVHASGMLTNLAAPAAEEHLGDLATWRKPTAGMFAWMKLQGGITDADQVIEYLKEEKVVVVPGQQPYNNKMCVCEHAAWWQPLPRSQQAGHTWAQRARTLWLGCGEGSRGVCRRCGGSCANGPPDAQQLAAASQGSSACIKGLPHVSSHLAG